MTSLRGPMLLTFGLALLGAPGCDEDAINPMAARQPRVNSYSGSEFYADGHGHAAPPEGTVPRQRITGNPNLTSGRIGKTNNYVEHVSRPDRRAAAAAGPEALQHHLRHLPRPAGRRGQHRGPADVAAPAAVADRLCQPPIRYIFEVVSKGHGLMASTPPSCR